MTTLSKTGNSHRTWQALLALAALVTLSGLANARPVAADTIDAAAAAELAGILAEHPAYLFSLVG